MLNEQYYTPVNNSPTLHSSYGKLLKNPYYREEFTADEFEKILSTKTADEQALFILNKNLTSEQVSQLLTLQNEKINKIIARTHNINAKQLMTLFRSKSKAVRKNLELNPYLNVDKAPS